MSKLRSLSTSFWSDPFIEELTPTQKLLFIYLITNDKTNMLGIYESSTRKISFETGIKKDDIEKSLKYFEDAGKVKYIHNHVILINYMKHQKFNTNMKKSAIDCYNQLPNDLKIKGVEVTKNNPSKGFETLLKGYGMVSKIEVEVEVEYEIEDKVEVKNKYEIPPFEVFLSHAKSKIENICEQSVKLKYDSWVENEWRDGNDKQIKNWKSKLTNTVQFLKVKEVKKGYDPTKNIAL